MVLIFWFLASQTSAWMSKTSLVSTPISSGVSSILGGRDLSDCTCPAATRSPLDILWSCLTTIFLCAWVAVHPNLPPPKQPKLKAALRRLYLMAWAIFVPEIMLAWALRQWIYARHAARLYRDKNWTMTHGFFLVMGGFVLQTRDEDLGTIGYDKFNILVKAGIIEFPTITAEEIKDRSKGDALAKGIVIVQTLWFVIQCFARVKQGLAIAELELSTLALCAFALPTYIFWWHKPLDVACHIPIRVTPTVRIISTQSGTPMTDGVSATARSRHLQSGADLEAPDGDAQSTSESHPTSFGSLWISMYRLVIKASQSSDYPYFSTFFQPMKSYLASSHYHSSWIPFIACFPFQIMGCIILVLLLNIVSFHAFVGHIFATISNGVEENADKEPDHLPTFYSPSRRGRAQPSQIVAYSPFWVMYLGGCVFGTIHILAWRFHFPSQTELLIWRICSLYMTFQAVVAALLQFIGMTISHVLHIRPLYASYPSIIVISLYFPLRLIIVIEALATLRQLPVKALLDIEWTHYIPHV